MKEKGLKIESTKPKVGSLKIQQTNFWQGELRQRKKERKKRR